MYTTDMYEGMIAETITIKGHGGDVINAYLARPLGPGPHPGMVLAHHMPGWDEWYRETARKFAHHGYATISPDLYHRTGPRHPRRRCREDLARRAERTTRSWWATWPPSMDYLGSLPSSSGKIGAFGTCSGGASCASRRVAGHGVRRGGRLLGRARGHVRGRAHAEDPGCAHRLHRRPLLSGPGPVW